MKTKLKKIIEKKAEQKTKHELRTLHLHIRDSIKPEQIRMLSSKIKENLYSLPEFANSKAYMIYASFKSEVYTHDMIQENLRKKRTCVPHMVSDDKIIPAVVNFFDELKANSIGILEPKRTLEFPMNELGLVIVPGIVFDEKGNRIGFGRGGFDRFLMREKCPKVGLAFESQIVGHIPFEKHDVPMDIIVTEKRIIRRRK